VLDDLLGLHATVALSPYLQLRARMAAFHPDRLDALLEAGRAAKVACMRRTLFIESAELVPLAFAATRRLTVRGQRRFLAAHGLTLRRYETAATSITEVLAGRTLDASELRHAVGSLEPLSPVITVMCDQGRLIRWRGSIGWQGRRPRYRLFHEALPNVRLDAWEERTAVRELVRRYVRQYGPVSENDIAWWTGLGKTVVREALGSLTDLRPATIEGLDGEFLIDEADIGFAQRGATVSTGLISLLPVLDPYLQGYRNRERVIDPKRRHFVVDPGGNSTSVILVGGRAAGVWGFVAQPSPELRVYFFDPADARTRRTVRTLASELAGFFSHESVPVVERDHMTPLTQRTAGGFLSPLTNPTSG
jgi:hypothetical protein